MEHCPSHEKILDDISTLKTKTAFNSNMIESIDERITKHRENNNKLFEEIKESLSEIKGAIVGTFDRPGLKTLVYEHEEFLRPQKAAINSIINWIYKGIMLLSMSYLLYLIGIKHLIMS